MSRYDQFQAYRSRMNCRILGDDHERAQIAGRGPDSPTPAGGTIVTKRFFRLDAQAYEPGALTGPTKELMGLVASTVLRCDDCIAYHIDRCVALGLRDEEIFEALDIALLVGGSIVIPHLRRGVEFLDEARLASRNMPTDGTPHCH